MRRIILSSAVLLLSASTIGAIAGGFSYEKEDLSGYTMEPNLQVVKDSDYRRDRNSVSIFGGFLYGERFLSDDSQPLFGNLLNYVPNQVLSSSFPGFEIGVSNVWAQHVDFQVAYMQYLKVTKSTVMYGNTVETSTKMSGMLGDVGYIFNPDDQFQVIAKLGVVVEQFYTTATIANVTYYTNEDDTKVDPAAGADCLFQLNKNWGLLLSALYIADTQGDDSRGEVNGLAAIEYTL